jgi:16S rRNA (guanine527-N7)-methyltransferase
MSVRDGESVRVLLRQRAELAHVPLSDEIAQKLEAYFTLLSRWNRTINLTSLPLEPPTDASIDRLLIEPLRAIPFLAPRPNVWFDLGSGGGSPAIPLQVAHPASRLLMVESKERKAAFLREVVRELDLNGAEVLATRIEGLLDDERSRSIADLVTVRAVRLSAPLFSQLDMLLKAGAQAALFGTTPQKLDLPKGLEIQRVEPSLILLRRSHV